jgi:prolyl 4-hydroxylase
MARWLLACAVLLAAPTRAQEHISVKFVNSGEADLAVHWSRPDGSLAAGMAVRPRLGSEVAQKTYPGHVWKVLRAEGSATPLRAVTIESKFGSSQTIDVATGTVRSVSDSRSAAVPDAKADAGSRGDIVDLWHKVQRRTEDHAKAFEAAAVSCSSPASVLTKGLTKATALSDALARDAGSPITVRCADGADAAATAGLAEHLAAQGCPNAPAWLSRSGLVRGYHVVCAQRQPLTAELRAAKTSGILDTLTGAFGGGGGAEAELDESTDGLALTVVPGGSATESVARSSLLTVHGMDMDGVRLRLEELAFVYKSDKVLHDWDDIWTPQPWRLFNTEGVPVADVQEVARGGLFLLYEGGQFIWPGIEKGYMREVTIHDRALTIETLELQPLILSIDGFLASEEVAKVVSVAEPRVKPSGVTMNDADRKAGKKNSDFRTSETYWMHSREHWIKEIDLRVANLTRTPVDYQEAVQVLRYKTGQYYGAHLDYTNRLNYGKNLPKMEAMKGTYENRMATVFWYLSDVEVGGSTYFPRAGGLPHPSNTRDCDGPGLHVQPKAGRGIVFYSLKPDGFGDEYAALRCAALRYAVLRCATLCFAVLRYAALRCASSMLSYALLTCVLCVICCL